MENSKVGEYWQKFKSDNNINSNRYEAWQFGFDADFLGELVLEGKKTSTAGALKSYQFENVDIPRLGQYNIVLDSKNQPLYIIRTTKVEIIPFWRLVLNKPIKKEKTTEHLNYGETDTKGFLLMNSGNTILSFLKT